ncbi:hypothetical protein PAPYR_8381 [Paratrimastix pyriformis]|uniref:Uncharacterized protein n=1 Tax=Paratrimastix pyriformis TaxID=342808 RepID=A0ABQ8UAT6_9EUKA|nr:hypothetical protein PAPYR_8381 [Paratrimastix pyriformis]
MSHLTSDGFLPAGRVSAGYCISLWFMSWFWWWVFGVLVTTLLGTPVHDICGDALWVAGHNLYFPLGDTVTDDIFREIVLTEESAGGYDCYFRRLVETVVSNKSTQTQLLSGLFFTVSMGAFCCGDGTRGQTCVGTFTDDPFTQVTLPDGKTLREVVAGFYHTILWMTDGSLFFKLNGNECIASPTLLTPALPANRTIVQIQAGGSNANGALGLGNTALPDPSVFTRIPLPTGRTATAISFTLCNLAVILDDGSVATCG